jgi:hypothetical protein
MSPIAMALQTSRIRLAWLRRGAGLVGEVAPRCRAGRVFVGFDWPVGEGKLLTCPGLVLVLSPPAWVEAVVAVQAASTPTIENRPDNCEPPGTVTACSG